VDHRVVQWACKQAERFSSTKAIGEFRSILEDRYPELERRGFDFSKDYEVINELGQTYYERSKMERDNPERQKEFLSLAARTSRKRWNWIRKIWTAHYTLSLIYAQLGDEAKATHNRREHQKYLPDYNAQDRAVSSARRADPACQPRLLRPQ